MASIKNNSSFSNQNQGSDTKTRSNVDHKLPPGKRSILSGTENILSPPVLAIHRDFRFKPSYVNSSFIGRWAEVMEGRWKGVKAPILDRHGTVVVLGYCRKGSQSIRVDCDRVRLLSTTCPSAATTQPIVQVLEDVVPETGDDSTKTKHHEFSTSSTDEVRYLVNEVPDNPNDDGLNSFQPSQKYSSIRTFRPEDY